MLLKGQPHQILEFIFDYTNLNQYFAKGGISLHGKVGSAAAGTVGYLIKGTISSDRRSLIKPALLEAAGVFKLSSCGFTKGFRKPLFLSWKDA
jgi:hypothetical protein